MCAGAIQVKERLIPCFPTFEWGAESAFTCTLSHTSPPSMLPICTQLFSNAISTKRFLVKIRANELYWNIYIKINPIKKCDSNLPLKVASCRRRCVALFSVPSFLQLCLSCCCCFCFSFFVLFLSFCVWVCKPVNSKQYYSTIVAVVFQY